MSRVARFTLAAALLAGGSNSLSASPAAAATLATDQAADEFAAHDVFACDCPGCVAYRARLEAFELVHNPMVADGLVLAQAAEPVQPLDVESSINQPSSFDQPPSDSPSISLASLVGLADFGDVVDASTESVQAAQAAPGGTVIPAQTAALLASPETASILRDAGPSNAVTVQRRNTVSYDPHVRGFRYGQVLSRVAGVWSPVRQDLDSPISKLDPSLIEDISVIPGPYASRFGPAFSFIDVETIGTPRNANGYETHYHLGETYRHNGSQQHGRVGISGGAEDWGYIGHYGNRKGSDYRSGNGTLIPSSYDNQTFVGQLGADLTDSSRIEVRYDRLDQNDTEYALQFFDINYLGNDSTSVRYTNTDPGSIFSRSDFDVWYNRTRYHGDNQNASKAPVRGRVEFALGNNAQFSGNTFGDRMLTGGRSMWTIGELGELQNRIGGDFRFEDQEIQEDFTIIEPLVAPTMFSTNLPKSWLRDTGVFNELVLPMTEYWSVTAGARVDFVETDARDSDIRTGGNLVGADLDQYDTLYGFYLLNDVALDSNWSTQFGFGHAQRAPSLVERYSDGVFLGIIQSGFSRVIGTPDLDKERLWQADWSLTGDYENFRGRAAMFSSWIVDFSTFRGNLINSPDGARLLYTTNTDLATFNGFELYGEGDASEYVTFFSGLNYVQGTDQTIDAPMWGVAPMIGRVGVRLHDGDRGQTWGVETSVRMVDRQDRAALIRNAFDPSVLVPIETVTPGFATVDLRSYYNLSRRVSLIAGVENMLDKNYLEHLDLRLPSQGPFPELFAFSPGFMFYTGIEISH